MDDNTFDDLVKGKLKNYVDPSIDSSALDDFHERMHNFESKSWYQTHATALALATLLIFTGVNALLLLNNIYLKKNPSSRLTKQSSQNTVDSLLAVVGQLQCAASEPVPAEINASPKFQLRLVRSNESIDPFVVNYRVAIGSREGIPEKVYTELKEDGFLAEKGGEVFLLLTRTENSRIQTALYTRPGDLLVPIPQPGAVQLIALNTDRSEKKQSNHVDEEKTSLAARNALEKHYFNKLGIQVGAYGDLMEGFFSQGTGVITPRIGFTADWVLSPRISIESGIDYGTTEIRFSGSETQHTPYDSQLGNLESATVTNRLLSIPLSFKYRQWVFDKSQLVLRAGYTPYGILSKQHQYNYVRPDINPDSDGNHISTVEKRDEYKFYGSTITASAGLTLNRRKSKNLWEASIFYEHGLGNGFEKSSMQLIGLRTAYWIKLK